MHNGKNFIKSSVKITVSAVLYMATELKPCPCEIKAIQQLLSLDFEARGQYFWTVLWSRPCVFLRWDMPYSK